MSLSPAVAIYLGLFSYSAVSASRCKSSANRGVLGVLGNIGQFIVERCDQQELLLYFRILHLARDGANVLRLVPAIWSRIFEPRGIHGVFMSTLGGTGRLAEHFCRRHSAVRSEGT
jgi:hypothetical protein